METLAEIRKAKAEMKALLEKKGKALLQDAFDAFFKEHPEVKALGWTQYTPYFNDGDSCEFSVNEVNAAIGDEITKEQIEGFSGYESEGWLDSYSADNGSQKKVFKAVKDFFGEVQDEEVFEAAFGDHVRVIATPGKFDVEEYSHD